MISRNQIRQSALNLVDTYLHRIPARHAIPFATHIPVLAAIPATVKVRKVLELGSGLFSTPTFLNQDVFPELIAIDSFENDHQWGEKVRQHIGHDKRFQLNLVKQSIAEAISDVDLERYDLILIDDSSTSTEREETITTIKKLKPRIPLIVIHDFEWEPYRRMCNGFEHVFRVTAVNPNVGLVWNGSGFDLKSARVLNNTLRQHINKVAIDNATDWASIWQKHWNTP